MKIKRIQKLKVDNNTFKVIWDKTSNGAYFSFRTREIGIGIKNNTTDDIFMLLCHELQEICSIMMGVRYDRPDCDTDYLFAYDHRQHTAMMCMFSGLLSQFIE